MEIIKYLPTKFYKRNGEACILCNIRNRLFKKVPEELVRQACINYLIHNKNVPIELIAIEFPLTRLKKGERKRADIIVYGDSEKKQIVLVIECKKGDWGITDKNIEQVKFYNSVFNANCIVVTNGIYFHCYKKFNNEYKPINIIPNFKQLRENHLLKHHIIKEKPYERHSLKKIYSPSTFKFFLDWGHIGVDSKPELYPFICNFVDFLFDKKTTFEKLNFNKIKVIKDIGTVIDSFGNEAGGDWNGEYKKLLIKDSRDNHQTIGFGVFGSMKHKNHPRFGNSKGYTYLIVSIDDYEKSHNSLQLNIDKHVILDKGFYYITHDGKLTNGHSGSLPFNIVINYIRKKAPHLLNRNGKIQLGMLPDNQLFIHSDINATKFIGNLIEYAILRDELRRGCR
jgi:hypothetical protein